MVERISLVLAAIAAAPAWSAPLRPPARPERLPRLVSLQTWPRTFSLTGPRSQQRLIVTGAFSDGIHRDITALADFRSTTREVATVQPDGRVEAIRTGLGSILVRVGSLTDAVRVAVREPEDRPHSFRREVIPALTRAGCNQGACHGAQLGKGGFRLSLLGYDPDPDFLTLTRDAGGRRITRTSPGDSLLLKKATLAVPHAGGMRFKANSVEYRILAGWIADGAPGPKAEEAAVNRVEVFPQSVLTRLPARTDHATPAEFPQVGGKTLVRAIPASARLGVTAYFADGTSQDVTTRAQFRSLNDAVVSTSPDGELSILSRGQSGVMVRYGGLATVAHVVAPYRDQAPAYSFAPKNFIDEIGNRKWREMGIAPSGECTDFEFMRRAHLDLIGELPTQEEILAFQDECGKERERGGTTEKARGALVDRLMARGEFADYWTLKWGDILRNNRAKLGEQGMWSLYNWLRAAFRENRPFDAVTRDLITAQGSTYTTGPANFYRVSANPADQAETTSQVFLGVRMQCARCHQHPFEKWSQNDYWQLAAFFGRVAQKNSEEFGIFGRESVIYLRPTGTVNNPRTGKAMTAKPLDGPEAVDPVDVRRSLATWITAPENPFFARNIVNRFWSYLMGRGLVEPVDDVRVTNPPTNPALLDALAADFVKSGYDIKKLLKTITSSAIYQRSSIPTQANKQDELFYSKYAVKRMGAEELLDAISHATGTVEKFPNLPSGFRAVQLPDPGVQSYFLDTFGRPERQITCECERTVEPNMTQALHLMNSDFVQNKIVSGTGRVAKALAAKRSDEETIREFYLSTFCRPPSAVETQQAQKVITSAPTRKEGLEDLMWALLNSREFIFKH